MTKAHLRTPFLADKNIAELVRLFPNCVTESKVENGLSRRLIDFDLLRQELSDHIVEGPSERYRLDWPGKREAMLLASAPIAKTLRPCRIESVAFDTTKNLFIEGDNLDALKLLQETYLGRVKLIYVDAPYNTGHEFIYADNFKTNQDDYLRHSNQRDEDGVRMVANPESTGRFHSKWLSMMYPRLKLCRNLLQDNGVIFLSIDDHELKNLMHLCDEVFGRANFLGCIPVVNNLKGRQTRFQAQIHEYLLAYQKSAFTCLGVEMSKEKQLEFDKVEDDGRRYKWDDLRKRGGEDRRIDREDMFFPIFVDPNNGRVATNIDENHSVAVRPIKSDGEDGRWRWGKERVEDEIGSIRGRPLAGGEGWKIEYKNYLDSDDGEKRSKAKSVWQGSQFSTDAATRTLNQLIKGINAKELAPKPVDQIKQIIELATDKDDIILDIFGGSGTTGHAVIELNAKLGSSRRFIILQIAEPCPEKTSAFKIGFSNIAEICKERIRRAGTMVKSDNAITLPDLDIGFRVLKVDTSNMKDIYYAPDSVIQTDLVAHADNIKEDRAPEDLLFQVLVDWGVDLALSIAKETIAGKVVFFVDGNALAACFDASISEELVKELANRKPLRAVFRDSSYGSDSVKINVDQIFKLLSPTTEIKSL
jgi:adenine-specific DNA-methyltransferase